MAIGPAAISESFSELSPGFITHGTAPSTPGPTPPLDLPLFQNTPDYAAALRRGAQT